MNIILAVDESRFSTAAVDSVASRPWPPGTTVRVLSAVEIVAPPAATLWYDAGGSLDEARKEMSRKAEDLTARIASALREKGLDAEPAVREGDPREVIVDEAREWPADLIVLGSHGRTGIKRWLMGSVASAVVDHAPCSVQIARLNQPEAS